MSTRSNIGYFDPIAKTGRVVYCHYDGYPEHNGRILKEHYSTPDKIIKLVELGALSVLGTEIGDKVDFERNSRDDEYAKSVSGQVFAFHRDRGDELEIEKFDADNFDHFQELVSDSLADNGYIEFVYLTETYAGCNEPVKWIMLDRKQEIADYFERRRMQNAA